MAAKNGIRRLAAAGLILFFAAMAAYLGNYHGYVRGFRDGQQTTNRWWIGKQSRYYDSMEVEKKRRLQELDLL